MITAGQRRVLALSAVAALLSGCTSLGPDEADGGFKLTGIALKVTGEVEGLDAAGFEQAAQDAKASCPVSKALTGVEITLDAQAS